MRLIYRCLLETHSKQSQMIQQAVSTSAFGGGHTAQHSVVTCTTQTSIHNGCSSMCAEDSSLWPFGQSSPHTTQTPWTFGLPFATGTIQFESLNIQESHSKLSQGKVRIQDAVVCSLPAIRVKIAPPRWLSCKVLEVIACRAQMGWKQHLRVRNVSNVWDGCPRNKPFETAIHNISRGDLNQLRSQFENGELTPWDETSRGMTLLMVS